MASLRHAKSKRIRWELWLARTGRWRTRRWTIVDRMLGGR